jgi:hypothetical protein
MAGVWLDGWKVMAVCCRCPERAGCQQGPLKWTEVDCLCHKTPQATEGFCRLAACRARAQAGPHALTCNALFTCDASAFGPANVLAQAERRPCAGLSK